MVLRQAPQSPFGKHPTPLRRRPLWTATQAGSHFEMLEELTTTPVLSRDPNG
jgi:hypothetical protein